MATTELYTYSHTLSLHDALPICDPFPADLDSSQGHRDCTQLPAEGLPRGGETWSAAAGRPPRRRRWLGEPASGRTDVRGLGRRTEEGRVGKGCVRSCSSRCASAN